MTSSRRPRAWRTQPSHPPTESVVFVTTFCILRRCSRFVLTRHSFFTPMRFHECLRCFLIISNSDQRGPSSLLHHCHVSESESFICSILGAYVLSWSLLFDRGGASSLPQIRSRCSTAPLGFWFSAALGRCPDRCCSREGLADTRFNSATFRVTSEIVFQELSS